MNLTETEILSNKLLMEITPMRVKTHGLLAMVLAIEASKTEMHQKQQLLKLVPQAVLL